jgi:esterase/lipase superfamily enzyme
LALSRIRHVIAAAMLAAAPVLAGCAGGHPGRLLDAVGAEPAEILATHRVFVATTRARADDRKEVFSGERSPALNFARVDVTIPKIHAPGQVEQPTSSARRDPARHFAAGEVALYTSGQGFSNGLGESLKKTHGRALVFVHGYRTPFDNSVYRTGQIIHDSGYLGTPVLFSWASTGRTVDYIYDNNSATVARDGLEETLRILRKAGATRIDIVAHSMGNWLTMETLRQLAMSGDRATMASLGDIILASPDIDVDVFKSQLHRQGRLADLGHRLARRPGAARLLDHRRQPAARRRLWRRCRACRPRRHGGRHIGRFLRRFAQPRQIRRQPAYGAASRPAAERGR